MRNTPEEREDLARRKEQWILRTEKGEAAESVRLELKLKDKSLLWARDRYLTGGRKWEAFLERRHGIATKGTAEVKAFLRKAKAEQPQTTGAELCAQVWDRFELEISLSRLNELLHAEGLSNTPGRPYKTHAPETDPAAERDVDHAGAFFPSGGVERTGRAGRSAKRGGSGPG